MTIAVIMNSGIRYIPLYVAEPMRPSMENDVKNTIPAANEQRNLPIIPIAIPIIGIFLIAPAKPKEAKASG